MIIPQIDYFLTLCETMNMTKAAKKLFITQPALSKYISTMEQELEVELFKRNNNRLSLTPAGEYLYNSFKNVHTEYTSAVNMCQKIGGASQSEITIGFETGWNVAHFISDPARIAKSIGEDIHITVQSYDIDGLIDSFANNILDIIVMRTRALNVLPRIQFKELGKVRRRLFFSAKHPLASKDNLSPYDFRDEIFFVLPSSRSSGELESMYDTFEHYGFTPITETIPNLESLIGSIQSCRGVALLDPLHKINGNPAFDYIELPETVSISAAWKDTPRKGLLKKAASALTLEQ